MEKTLMGIGAHADDIELGIGGTFFKYMEKGYKLIYVMATNNMSGGRGKWKKDGGIEFERPSSLEEMAIRKSEAAAGARMFGTEPIHLNHPQRHYNLEDGSTAELRYGAALPEGVPEDAPSILTAHEDEESQERVVKLIFQHNPEFIITHGLNQSDIEHYGTTLLVTKSFWRAVEKGYKGGLLYFLHNISIHGEMSCRWNAFVDIGNYFEKKQKAVSLHKSQMLHRHPLRNINSAWGTACGCELAEVFTIGKRPELDSALPTEYMNYYPSFSMEIMQNS